MREPFDLFISYAREDEPLRAELDQHLALLERQGEIRPWHQREIAAGEEWRGQIDDRLEAADLILLLVSSSFLASDYCFDDEANRALGRHVRGEARVIPVVVRPCDWATSPFAELQALPKNGEPVTTSDNRDQAWLDVVRGLRASIAELRRAGGEAPERREERQPRYPDDESRQLSHRLKSLFKRRKDLTLAGGDTVAVEAEILDVRRLLRKGPQLRPGEFLGDGRYELIEAVGQGGFATVWKAWDGDDQRPVALKVLHGHYSEDRGKRERFFRGARKMAELAHPHVVRVLAVECADDGWHFFVMEYLGGGNFEQAVLSGELSPDRRLEILLQAGEALEHAHRRGAVHRDVKPSNILLDEDGTAKLSDFDLVRAADTTGLTATRAMLGTVQFAAPEALESAGDAGPAADVYSLASTVVFALAGGRLPPWYYRDPARAIGELDCGAEQKRVLERATAFEVEERYSSVGELCRGLGATAVLGAPASRRHRAAEPPATTQPQELGPEAGRQEGAPGLSWIAPEPEADATAQAPAGSERAVMPLVALAAPGEALSVPDPQVDWPATDSAAKGHKARLWKIAVGGVAALALALWLPLPLGKLLAPDIDPTPAGGLVTETASTDPLGMRYRYIRSGKFQMGSPATETGRDDDEILHEVELTRDFWIGETEVTQAQWRQLMKSDPSGFKNCGDDCPVESVNWFEAVTFANRLSGRAELTPCYAIDGCDGTLGGGCDGGQWGCNGDYSCATVTLTDHACEGFRLPTEAEWEFAARAGEERAIYTGNLSIQGARDAPELNAIAWYGGNSKVDYEGGYDCSDWPEKQEPGESCGTHRVGEKAANGWGLHDVLGNVWEWNGDWFGDYPQEPLTNPPGMERGSARVVRGGGWGGRARRCRSADRNGYAPGNRYAHVGFRLVRTAD